MTSLSSLEDVERGEGGRRDEAAKTRNEGGTMGDTRRES